MGRSISKGERPHWGAMCNYLSFLAPSLLRLCLTDVVTERPPLLYCQRSTGPESAAAEHDTLSFAGGSVVLCRMETERCEL